MPPDKFRVGLIQMSMTSDPDRNLQHAIDLVADAAVARREDRLPAGAFSDAIFLSARRYFPVRSRRADSRTDFDEAFRNCKATRNCADRVAV